MSSYSKIALQFKEADTLAENYWARIDVLPPQSDYVALSEAATVIDAIYDIEPCSGDESVGGEETELLDPEEVPSILAGAFGMIEYDPCKFKTASYDYEATVYVYRSHNNIPYKMVVNDGLIIRTERVTKRIHTLIKPEDRVITTDYPIMSNIVCPYNVVAYTGARALLDMDVVTNIPFEYDTQFDKVTILVKGTEMEAQEAVCTVFYYGLAFSADVAIPEEDAQAVSTIGCGGSSSSSSDDGEDDSAPDTGVCYKRYIYSNICECSGIVRDSSESLQEVACPESPATPHSDTPQGAYNNEWDAVHIDTYVRCEEEEGWEGQDGEFYEDNCCTPMPDNIRIPNCREKTAAWKGGAGIKGGADKYTGSAESDEAVSLVGVGPEDGICGTITWKQDVVSRQCCEEATPIVIDAEASVDVIADYSQGTVSWSGGIRPVTFSVSGDGFFANAQYTKTSVELNGGVGVVYTEDACGSCTVTVDDGCSQATYTISAIDGNWVTVDCGGDCGEGLETDNTYHGPIPYDTGFTYKDNKIWFYQFIQQSRNIYTRYATAGEACGESGYDGHEQENFVGHVGEWEKRTSYYWHTCSTYVGAEYWDAFTPIGSTGPKPGWSNYIMLYNAAVYKEWRC